MSQENIRQYKRDTTAINPFKKPSQPHKNQKTNQGLPGSAWDLPQIEWLGIKFEWSCDIAQMLSSDSEFQPNSQLQRSIVGAWNMPWKDIVNSKDLDKGPLYSNLSQLASISKPLGDYDRSSTLEGSTSEPAPQDRDSIPPSPEQEQGPSAHIHHIRSSPPSMPGSLSPRLKRRPQFTLQDHGPRSSSSSPLSSPPATIKSPTPFSQRQPQFTLEDLNPRSPPSSPLSSPPAFIKSPTPFSQRLSLKSAFSSRPDPHDQERSEVREFVDDQDGELGDEEILRDADSGPESDLLQLPSRYDPEDAPEEDDHAQGQRTPHSFLPSSSATERRSTRRRTKTSVNYVPEGTPSDVDTNLGSRRSSEDLDYHVSTSEALLETPLSEAHIITKAQLQAEHKSEEDVKFAARVFLTELAKLFRTRCEQNRKGSQGLWDLQMVLGPGENTKGHMIDTYTIVSNADVTLAVTTIDKGSEKPRDREVRLIVECKPAQHRLSSNAIFAQEVAHMLMEMLRLRDYHCRDRYTVYLISCHHLECYFGRMDASEAYLAQLHDTSNLANHEAPHVRQSHKLSLRDDRERVKIGEISARIVIEMLAMYKQLKKLGIIRHLTF